MIDDGLYDEEDIWDAVADFRRTNHWCDVCDHSVNIELKKSCDHPKNGYCALFRAQAALDKVTHNMAAPRFDVEV